MLICVVVLLALENAWLSSSPHGNQRNEHLFHTDTPMLERIFVVRYVIIVVVGVGKEAVSCGENVAGANVWRRQLGLVRLFDGKNLFSVIVQVLAQLITKVGVSIAVAHYLYGFRGAYRTVVGCENHGEITL